MNKITFTTNLFLAIYCLFSLQANAQEGYTYTLIDNGGYSFSIGAVPNTSTSNFATSVQSYGFTIIVPDGATTTITTSLGGAASATFFNGTDVGMPAIDGYLITETLGSPSTLPAPSSATTTSIVTIQINGAPTSGTLEILANDSTLATTITPLKSFMQADMVDNGTAEFVNVVDPNASGLSGTTTFDFSTLSTADKQLQSLRVYPNPTTDVIHIIASEIQIEKVEIYTTSGQLVLSKNNNLEKIYVNNLQTGIYLMKIYSKKGTRTLKLSKQ